MADISWNPEDEKFFSNLVKKSILDRRGFLGGALAVAGGAVLAPLYPVAKARAAVGGELKLMAWEGFGLREGLKEWREKNGVTVNLTIISTPEDPQVKLVGGSPVTLDVAEVTHSYTDLYETLKISKPIDLERVPNYNADNIYKQFYKEKWWNFDGVQKSIPWIWGMDMPLYAEGAPPIKSLHDFLQPDYEGKLTMIDGQVGTFDLAARLAGFGDKYPLLTRDEMAQSYEFLKKWRGQIRTFASSNGDVASLIASKEVLGCFCTWTGIPAETKKAGVVSHSVVPVEGGVSWCDAWFLPTTVENEDTAYEFMNQSLDPVIQAKAAKTAASAAVSSKAFEHMDDETKALFDYEQIDQAIASSPLRNLPPTTSEEYATYEDWLQGWADFRSGF